MEDFDGKSHGEASTENKHGLLKLQIRSFGDVSTSVEKETIYSPVTELAINLNEHLTTRNSSFGGTPKRKLCLNLIGDTPTPTRPTSFRSQLHRPPSIDQGCFVDTPTPSPSDDSPLSPNDSPYTYSKCSGHSKEETDVSPRRRIRKSAFRRFRSLPNGCLSQSFPPAERPPSPKVAFSIGEPDLASSQDSQDSGIGKDEEFKEELKDDFKFVAPVGLPPRSSRHFMHDETSCSPHSYSPVKNRCTSAPAGSLEFSAMKANEATTGSPILLGMSSLTSSMNDEDTDDGFLDTHFMDDYDMKHGDVHMPSGLSGLLTAPIVSPGSEENNENKVPSRRSVTRGLFRSPSVPDFHLRRPSAFKRPDPPKDLNSPVSNKDNKRRKSMLDNDENLDTSIVGELNVLQEVKADVLMNKRRLHRCHSESEAMIKSALNKVVSEPDLVGDCSTSYCLPTIPGRHQDLKSITPETLRALMRNEYSHVIEKFIIIDCRYPYEYDGGHIQGAENIYTKDHALKEFLEDPSKHTAVSEGKRCILIFHCEFSSERAPKLSRFIRNRDRDVNKDTYPYLHYPEMYLLHNGYKNFFESQKELCEPQTYKPMLHKEHSEDLRHFRIKSKSWAGDSKGRYGFRTGLKF